MRISEHLKVGGRRSVFARASKTGETKENLGVMGRITRMASKPLMAIGEKSPSAKAVGVDSVPFPSRDPGESSDAGGPSHIGDLEASSFRAESKSRRPSVGGEI